MIPKPLSQINAADITALIQNQRMEDQWLDYKLELPSRSEKDLHSLASDVAAFANTIGGDLIYGVDEERDAENRPTGLPRKIVGVDLKNVDLERTRLQQTIHSRLDPSPNISFETIDGFDQGSVLVLRVERALNGPLMVRASSRFYVRRHTQNVPLERVSDIRDLILGAGSTAQRIRDFRLERLAMIARGETPIPLPDVPLLVVHAIPASYARKSRSYNINDLGSASQHMPLRGGITTRPNLDGHLAYFEGNFGSCYVQAFRSGAIESVDAGVGPHQDSDRTIPGGYLDRRALQYLQGCSRTLQALGAELPFYFGLSLLNVKDYTLLGPDRFYRVLPNFDRLLISTEIEVNEWPQDLGLAAKPILDLIWQSAGHLEDPYVDDDGRVNL